MLHLRSQTFINLLVLEDTMRKNVLPYAPAERIMKLAGAKRVSQEAKVALMQILEEEAVALIGKALDIMKNCNRKTILGEDLRLAK